MGLDNIPHEYPCTVAGSAVRVGDKISCEATMSAGGCPWKTAADSAPQLAGPVIGMFGTLCWYRGKVGTWYLDLLEEAGYDAPGGGFYGQSGRDGDPDLTPEFCVELATFMQDHAEVFSRVLHDRAGDATVDVAESDIPEILEGYRYAIWWLRFTAAHAAGANAWY
jgi:hypothetical protein